MTIISAENVFRKTTPTVTQEWLWPEPESSLNMFEYLIFPFPNINGVHTRCIVKTSGFTRGVRKNRRFIKNV